MVWSLGQKSEIFDSHQKLIYSSNEYFALFNDVEVFLIILFMICLPVLRAHFGGVLQMIQLGKLRKGTYFPSNLPHHISCFSDLSAI